MNCGFFFTLVSLNFCIPSYLFIIVSDSQLTRKAPAFYTDGVYRMSGNTRPSPRSISQALMKGNDGLPSRRNKTAMHTFFGKI